MIPELRRAYNAAFTAERYQALQDWLDAQAGLHIPFRICETPLFLPRELAAELERAAYDSAAEIAAPSYREAAARAIPAGYGVPGEDAHPTFLQVDMALALPPDGEE